MRNEEQQIQTASIRFIDQYFPRIAEKLFSIPNEMPAGYMFGHKLNQMGRRKGAWDCFLSIKTKKYAGLYIEFKSKQGSLSPDQLRFAQTIGNDYCFVVVRSTQEFYDEIRKYLAT